MQEKEVLLSDMQDNKLKRNNIYLGDCYELIKQIEDSSIDLIVIDPPYQIDGKPKSEESLERTKNEITKCINKLNQELMDNNITQGIREEIFDEFMRIMKVPNIYIWCNRKQIPMYLNYFVNILFSQARYPLSSIVLLCPLHQ